MYPQRIPRGAEINKKKEQQQQQSQWVAEAQEFDMLAVEVILGDGAPCTLDFAESSFLCRLLSIGGPVRLSFGTTAAVQELRGIVALRHSATVAAARRSRRNNNNNNNNNNSGVDGVNDSVGNVRAHGHTSTGVTIEEGKREKGSASTGNNTAASGNLQELEDNTKLVELKEYVRKLSENRKLFMDVLELTVRLEMEETIPLLCNEFSRIYSEEVRNKFTIELLSSWERTGAKLREVEMLRTNVMRSFALEDASINTTNNITKILNQENNNNNNNNREEYSNSRNDRTTAQTQRWLKQLKEDRYFFPHSLHLEDLTQSVDPSAHVVHHRTSCIDEEFATKFSQHPFQNPTWEADDSCKTCPVCGSTFASWSALSFGSVRASHCRCCGRRICSKCTSWQLDKSIAKLSKPGAPEEGRMRRVCKGCFEKAQQLNKHAFLCEIFVSSGLSLTEIALMRCINAQWKGAAELCLSDYRTSLYQNISWDSIISPQTALILSNSVDILAGHPEPLILLFTSLDWNNEQLVKAAHTALIKTVEGCSMQQKQDQGKELQHPGTSFWRPPVSHWYMLCTRACGFMLPPFFGIKMLLCLHRAPDENSVAESMRTMITQKLLLEKLSLLDYRVRECMVPLILDVFDLKSCQSHATSVLLELTRLEQNLALMIFQETLTRSKHDDLSYRTLGDLIIKVDSSVRPEKHQHFLNTLKFLSILTEIWRVIPRQPDMNDASGGFDKLLHDEGFVTAEKDSNGNVSIIPMLFPFDTNILVTHINVNNIVRMNSKQRPVMIPLIDSQGNTRRILYKKENLEKDKIMCITSRFLQWVLNKRLRHIVLPTYHVMPLNSSSGIIEIVEEGETVQHVIEQYKERRLLQHLVRLESLQQQQQQQKERKDKPNFESTHDRSTEWNKKQLNAGIRENFISSAKFFILMNYIFAIGDRHRDNVMLHPSGAIFHIDFGMILKTRTLAERVTTSYVRFDLDLEECVLEFMCDKSTSSQQLSPVKHEQAQYRLKISEELDITSITPTKKGSDSLSKFLMETASWFLEVRPYSNILYQLLSHIVHGRALDGVSSLEELMSLMNTIFLRDASEKTCKDLFCDRVRKSRGQTWLKDFTHDTQKKTWSMLSEGYKWIREKAGLSSTETQQLGEELSIEEVQHEEEEK